MSPTKPLAGALSAALLLAGAGPAQALSGEEEAACGALLCLAGGSGVAACAPYLARYFAITAPSSAKLFERRLDFLSLCPAPDLPGDVRALLARDGARCQPPELVRHLNDPIRRCERRAGDAAAACRPTGNEWRTCAAFYDHAYTTYEAPRLQERCRRASDPDGYVTRRCAYTWTTAETSPEPIGRVPARLGGASR
jgi:hypothetical protein